ncbi:phasin family protein [Streptococcus equinus]|uniref:phasin family protein n=1 Tax=Streptococcus equinus TaxID=1335 RepID=UPI003BF8EF10
MEELKKVLLAGIGLTSMTLEKADAFVKELVEKGRLTVDEGRELQSELKRRSEDEAKEFLTDLDRKTKPIQYATKEDVSRLEDKIDALLKKSNILN